MDKENFTKLLATGVRHGATDIHFIAGTPPAYRMRGKLVPIKGSSLKPSDTVSVVEMLTEKLGRFDLKTTRQVETSYSVDGLANFRVNVFKQSGSFCAVLRIIPKEIPTVESLGLPAIIKRIALTPSGLVLVTGPRGSGKTTTLAAMVNEVNANWAGRHIMTIEDPVEYRHHHRRCFISHREVGHDVASIAEAIGGALRQDPDVIMIGELTDRETVDLALVAAESGHLVYSSFYTTYATRTIERLISMFPPQAREAARFRIADSLKATISQKLISDKDGSGWVVAAEIMIMTDEIQDCIVDPEKTSGLGDLIREGNAYWGTQSFDQHLSQLYRDDRISLETATNAATSPADLERSLSFEA